jgi:hypothetical protein
MLYLTVRAKSSLMNQTEYPKFSILDSILLGRAWFIFLFGSRHSNSDVAIYYYHNQPMRIYDKHINKLILQSANIYRTVNKLILQSANIYRTGYDAKRIMKVTRWS